MAATYIEVSATKIEAMMSQAGFSELSVPGCAERVFVRQHHVHSKVQVRVYTSLNRTSNTLRDVGKDRMRVTAFYTDGSEKNYNDVSRFLFGAKGVNRASGEQDGDAAMSAVLDRLLERMREVYALINKAPRCPKCSEPLREACSKKKGPNHKRPYTSCLKHGCGHFQWIDRVKDHA